MKESPVPQGGPAQTRPMEMRTLFFNMSNHPEAHSRNFYAVIAGRAYPLERVAPSHPVLLEAKRMNAFLRAVPPQHITHALVNVPMATDAVSLSYTVAAADPATGAWDMPHIFFNVPTTSLSYAYQQARKGLSEGEPLKLSAKRAFYGIEPARTLQELIDESALIDPNEHAVALTIMHPDVLNVDPDSAANVKTNYVETSSSTQALGKKLSALGPAMPAGTSSGSGGWATLNPVTDDKGNPLKFSSKTGPMSGLIQYAPDFNPDLGSFISASTADASTGVKNDTTMGADISAGIPNAGNVQGKTWSIHNGVTSVNQGALNITASRAGDTITLAIVKVNDDAGFILDGSASGLQTNLEATNSFVRFLGIYIVFYKDEEQTNVIPYKNVPSGISANSGLDLPGSNAVYLGTINPQFTLFGAPILNATYNMSFTWPGNASSAQVLASGLGGSGSHYDQQTEIIGIIMTTLFCFIAPSILVGVAAVPGAFTGFLKALLAGDFLTLLLEETLEIWQLIDGNKANLLTIFWQALVKSLAYPLTGFITAAVWFFAYVNLSAVTEAAELALPIAGVIIKAIAAAEVVADLARATHDVVVSPWTYRTKLTLTQDITVGLAPAAETFPEAATHYIPTAIFDDGMPHQLPPIQMPSPPPGQQGVTSLPNLVFKDVPVGGQVNVLVAFYADSDWQAGQGATGLLPNVPATFEKTPPPTITVTQNQIPIGPTTQYQHKYKTALDANGNRVWFPTNTGPTENATGCENAPGQICSFRKITVTQGTSSLPGNIGYAWEAYSSAVTACAGGGTGQLDQMANIGSLDPQARYAASACGLNPGVKLAYSLQANPAANFYLDSSNNMLRQVQLAPPQFSDPRQKQAVGMLNLDSTDLLLHPGGKVVSVNAENHKIESLRFSPVALSDDQAAAQFTAELYSGHGTRPGLMDTPSAAAITREGVVLVLESGNSRIHALDTCANPVPLFSKQSQQYFLTLTTTDSDNFEYLDMAVEYSGYIYILVRNINSGTYQLDIYHPNQSGTAPITTTLNVNAARLAVDMWRTAYTLNYEVLKLPSGAFPGITEPTVSLWTPSVPGQRPNMVHLPA
jgi:hypothetical protein